MNFFKFYEFLQITYFRNFHNSPPLFSHFMPCILTDFARIDVDAFKIAPI